MTYFTWYGCTKNNACQQWCGRSACGEFIKKNNMKPRLPQNNDLHETISALFAVAMTAGQYGSPDDFADMVMGIPEIRMARLNEALLKGERKLIKRLLK